MKERDVSRYLTKRVKELGGEIRRVSWIGRNNAPDKLVGVPGAHCWAEEKRPGKDANDAQAREHKRMRAWGMVVFVIDTEEDVEKLCRYLLREQKKAQRKAEAASDKPPAGENWLEVHGMGFVRGW